MNAHAAIPESFPALVLNADFRPLSYYPLSLWSWQESVKAVFLDRVNIVSEYDRFVRSPSFEMRLPSVVSLKTYVKPALYPAFTRFNVFLRDRFTCQYCGAKEDLTFDHLIPRSRGGQTRWDNVVAACAPCNLSKGGQCLTGPADAAQAEALPADGVRAAPQRAPVPAQLPAPELARLSLLGYRAGAVIGFAKMRSTRYGRYTLTGVAAVPFNASRLGRAEARRHSSKSMFSSRAAHRLGA